MVEQVEQVEDIPLEAGKQVHYNPQLVGFGQAVDIPLLLVDLKHSQAAEEDNPRTKKHLTKMSKSK